MSVSLPPLLWVSCTSSRSGHALLEECRRLCQVSRCTPAQAVDALTQSPPFAVIFDFDEPEAPQLQLLQSVKRQHPSVPILMITETHSEELAVWAFRARVWNYLVKPVPLREIKANLRQLVKVAERRNESGARLVERPGAMLPATVAGSEQQSDEAIMRRAIERIRKDHSTQLSIAQLAKDSGMTRFAFSRLFSRTYGCSCRDYVMRLRIETACRLLATPGTTVTEIAVDAGFADASYFARIFRRYVGKSPKEYAKLNAGERQRLQRLSTSR